MDHNRLSPEEAKRAFTQSIRPYRKKLDQQPHHANEHPHNEDTPYDQERIDRMVHNIGHLILLSIKH